MQKLSTLLVFLIHSYMFRGTDVPSRLWHQSATVLVHYTKSCIYRQKVLLRMGEFVARNM